MTHAFTNNGLRLSSPFRGKSRKANSGRTTVAGHFVRVPIEQLPFVEWTSPDDARYLGRRLVQATIYLIVVFSLSTKAVRL